MNENATYNNTSYHCYYYETMIIIFDYENRTPRDHSMKVAVRPSPNRNIDFYFSFLLCGHRCRHFLSKPWPFY